MKTRIVTRWLLICAAAWAWSSVSAATAADANQPAKPQAKAAAKPQPGPKPTLADVPYGTHPKQVLDFYKAESATPTPLVFYIHGGGWMGGSKTQFDASEYLKAGHLGCFDRVSLRLRRHEGRREATGRVAAARRRPGPAIRPQQGQGVEHRQDPHRRHGRVGRGVFQPVAGLPRRHGRSPERRSGRPGINPPDLCRRRRRADDARPEADEGMDAQQPLRRARVRLQRRSQEGPLAVPAVPSGRDKILPWIKEYSPYALVTADDPPVFLSYCPPPALGQDQKDPTHTANFGVKLQEKCRSVGVECHLAYAGAKDLKYRNVGEFLIAKLKEKGTEKK